LRVAENVEPITVWLREKLPMTYVTLKNSRIPAAGFSLLVLL